MRVGIVHRDARFRARLEQLVTLEYAAECSFSVADCEGTERLVRHHRPDIVLLDLSIPEAQVVALTHALVQGTHCAILLLESGISSETSVIFECLGCGASDVARLPKDPEVTDLALWDDFRSRFLILARLSGHGISSEGHAAPLVSLKREGQEAPPLVILGASTGGPRALSTVLSRFRPTLNAAVIIVQHLDAHFYPELADWLGTRCSLPVTSVTESMPLSAGRVYLAARPEHLVMTPDFRLDFSSEWKELICRPSIDVFFKSVAETPFARGAAALLTGMGKDGAEGLLALRKAGFHTLSQDEASSVIYGMPKAAREMGASESVLPIGEIGARLSAWVGDIAGSQVLGG